ARPRGEEAHLEHRILRFVLPVEGIRTQTMAQLERAFDDPGSDHVLEEIVRRNRGAERPPDMHAERSARPSSLVPLERRRVDLEEAISSQVRTRSPEH